MLEDLSKKAKSAQKAGDLKALEMFEMEKENLQKKNELPKTFKTDKSTYQNEIRTVRKKVDDAYANGIKEYTKNGKIALAKSLEERQLEFQKGGDPFTGMDKENAKKTLSDILSVGASISGSWTQKGINGSGNTEITITERDGDKYKATCVIKDQRGNSSDWTMTGEIKGGQFTWSAKPVVGNFSNSTAKLSFNKNNILEGTWSNTRGEGGDVTFKLAK
jgi:hypothetical protein